MMALREEFLPGTQFSQGAPVGQAATRLRCCGPSRVTCTPLVFFDPQYRGVLDKLKYGNEGADRKGRTGPAHWVPAREIYTKEDDGLVQPWSGRSS